jgi:hypothetical protein
MNPTRRRALEAAAAGSLTALAGCAGRLGGDPPEPSTLRRWVPAPTEPLEEGLSTRSISYEAVREVAALSGTLEADPTALALDQVGVEPESVDDAALIGDGIYVYLGEFDADELLETFGLDQDDEYRGTRVATGTSELLGGSNDTPTAVAVDGERFVLATGREPYPGSDGPESTVRRLLDVAAGEGERYADDADYGAALDRVEDGDLSVVRDASGAPPESTTLPAGVKATGLGVELGSDTTEGTAVYVFEDADAVDRSAVAGQRPLGPSYGEFSYEVDGRVVVGTTTADTDDLVDEEPETPQATFEFEWDTAEAPEGEGVLTVTHTGGDTFDAENTASLAVAADGERRTTFELPVSAGSSIELTVAAGREVRVVWTGPDGDQTATVALFETPA